jgi:3-dehydroquinate synthase
MNRTVRVELGPRSYEVQVGPGLIASLGKTAAQVARSERVVVISDSTVTGLYGRQALHSLASAGLTASLIDFPAGEANKTLATAGRLLDKLFALSPAIGRDCLITALGGGVPGDVAGFVSAVALRGLRWMQCPTTLLADVDASVGGKTGVDHPAGKNLIGAFHQPAAVLIDVRTLKTLGPQDVRSGLAECVKHAMIADADMLSFIDANADAILARDERTMTDLIARNVAIKAAVVAADEREAGVRAHLNFGHTVGHAIEAFAGFGGMTHGQAVALGMIAACTIAEKRGLVGASTRETLVAVLGKLGLATHRPGLDAERVWDIMQHDKKARAGKVRFVLPVGPGKVDIFDDVREQDVIDAIRALGEGR